ncbi:TfoX/Sxy family protein [soil metagenome]
MVGGLSFLVGGHMTVCVSGQGGLLVRVGAAEHPTLVRADHVEPMVMGARASRTWVQVGAAALSDGRGLEAWVARGVMTAAALPAK